MKLKELKESLLGKKVPAGLIVFVCKGDSFLAEQYIDRICSLKRCQPRKISSLEETADSALSLVIDYSEGVNLLRTETFSEFSDDYSGFANCVVLCDKIDPKLRGPLEGYAIEMPAPEEWQIKDYMKALCPELDDPYVDWLYKSSKGDVRRITNELDKIRMFPKNERKEIAAGIRFDPASDLSSMGIFDLGNAVTANDKRTVLEYLWRRDACGIEPLALTNLLLGSFKKTLLINWGSGLTAAELGISPKQYAYLSRHAMLPEKFLKKAVRFLADIDYRLKSGKLDMEDDDFTDYVLCRVMAMHAQG